MAKILLAESDQRIRNFIAGILTDVGHEVEVCAAGATASRCLRTKPIDVVVTDWMLHGRGGTMFGADCAALGIPMITLAGSKFHVDRVEADPPKRLFDKPFRFADLQSILDAVDYHCLASNEPRPEPADAA